MVGKPLATIPHPSYTMGSRGITTLAQEYTTEGNPELMDHPEQSMGVPRSSASTTGKNDRVKPNATRCAAKPQRILHDKRATVSEGFTLDPSGNQMREDKLMARVREAASKVNN